MPANVINALQKVGIHLLRRALGLSTGCTKQYLADIAEDLVRPRFKGSHITIFHAQHLGDHHDG